MTLAEMQEEFSVSRRTAERMRDAVERAFGPLEQVELGERSARWRLRSSALRGLVSISADELVELEIAAEALDRRGLDERATLLRGLTGKLRALSSPDDQRRVEPDLETLMEAEGLAMRAGPRPRIEYKFLACLRNALKARRVVAFRYLARSTGRRSYQRVKPHGLLYGNRSYLVGPTEKAKGIRYWVLANMSQLTLTEDTFELESDFDLREHASRSFGTYQEEPRNVVLRFDADAAADAAAFLFHPGQEVTENEDGSFTVRFTAGGSLEICWHLFTWGETVTIEQPESLREQMAGMCSTLANHYNCN